MKKIILLLFVLQFVAFSQDDSQYSFMLKDNWKIQSSGELIVSGKIISTDSYDAKNWYPTTVPSTVLAALVRNGVYKDIFVGENLKTIPKEQFKKPWWYRNEFTVRNNKDLNFFKIKFEGINYKANIWLNGKLVADTSTIFGTFRHFELDVTSFIKLNGKNVLAVEVIPPVLGDYTMGFVDWNPEPPDNNMGIWRSVEITQTGNVSINFPNVQTRFTNNQLKEARLSVSAELKNNSSQKISGVLEGVIDSKTFSKKIELEPNQNKKINFSPFDFKELNITNPRVWWTYDLGKPELYNLKLTFKEDSVISDEQNIHFGIREVSDYFTKDGFRGYKLNRKKILIRGGGWTDNMLLDNTYANLKAQVEYAKQMNLNALRFEGFWGTSQDIYNLCDEEGILLMVGWSCQWEWGRFLGMKDNEYGTINSPSSIKLISESWKDQIKWLRNHPSIFVWLYGSDKYPNPELEENYIKILFNNDPTRPVISSAAEHTSSITGKSRVKMRGPYDYVPPSYWYIDTANGGAFGFNTETGPGPQVPIEESIKKFIPENHLWPIDSVWYFHCGGAGKFKELDRYTEAMDERLGTANSLEEYCTKAQFLNYEGMRAMFEAFVANRYKATGIIQWMYNSAWPKFWWQFYDYYLMPTAAFYGARKACEPVHILYNYGTNSILAVNNSTNSLENLKAEVKVFNFDLSPKFSFNKTISLKPDENIIITSLDSLKNLDTTYFVDLRLYNDKNEIVSSNFYCLSTTKETLDYSKNTWFVTPVKQYADLKELNNLPKTDLNVKASSIKKEDRVEISVDVENPSNSLALQVELNLFNSENNEAIVPIFWDDNYFSLLPGEKKTVSCYYYKNSNENVNASYIKIKGWNINEKKIALTQ